MKKALACSALLLCAFALRLYALDAQSLWYDEAVTADVAAKGLRELTRWTANDIQPPLYYYAVAGVTRLAGRSEWALRFLSVFFSTLTLALVLAAGRRLLGWRGAYLAALLAAVSPLYVYYAQEARMYSLLTFLALLCGYALLRAAAGGPARGEIASWIGFAAAGVAMLYTHYFGALLLAAYGLLAGAVAAVAYRRAARDERLRLRRRVTRGALAFLAVAVLYAPWLPAMLNRYAVDASYWQGPLKMAEAVRHLAVSFVGGAPETMLEGDAVRWLPAAGAALLMAGAGWLVARPRPARWVGLLLLAVVVLPVLFVLVLASRTPKFNPRYLMIVSPAWFLLLGGGLSRLASVGRGARIAAAGGLALVLAPALLGLWNWYAVPAFTKAQWREAAAYVRGAMSPDEAVVLVSGHSAPAWDYYAAGVPPVRLPPIDILDVNAVLGFDDAPALAEALEGKRGAWLLTWQDEVIDPLQIVPFLLDRAGEAQAVDAGFWHVGVRHWLLPPGTSIPPVPQPEHATGANFDHKLELLGWDAPRNGELTVYWRTLNTLTEDYQVSLILEDASGAEVARWDGRPAAYNYPATRWQPGEIVYGRYPLSVPPGEYTASLAVYSLGAPDGLDLRDVADNPAGKRVRLGPFTLTGNGAK